MVQKRVLHIVAGMGIGGIENMVMNFYRNIDRSKLQFDFYCLRRDGNIYLDEIRSMGGKVFLSKNGSANKYLALFVNYWDLYHVIKDGGYQIVHIHSCSLWGMLNGTLPARGAGVGMIICHGHNPGIPKGTVADRCGRWILKQMVGSTANRYFACSREVAISKYPNRIIRDKRYEIIKNAIDLERFRYDENTRKRLREKLGLEDALILGSISRLGAQKNHEFMLDIFERVSRREPRAVLLIIGGGSLEAVLKEKVRRLGLEKKVIFYGAVEDAAPFYQAVDIYLSSSFYEGLSVSLVEAQASGCMCISSPVSEETHVSKRLVIRALTDSPELWCESILKLELEDRAGAIDEVKKSGFEIKEEAKRLEHFYLG